MLFLGAGAIGTYIGASLYAAGNPVTFVEKAAVAERLRDNGIQLDLPGRTLRIHAPDVKDSLQAALERTPFDLLIFALKSFDTQAAVDELGHITGQLPAVLCLQNGVENEALIGSAIGEAKVIPGTVTSAIGRKADGVVTLERLRGIGIASGHPLSNHIVQVFTEAGLNPRLYGDARAMKWSKLLTNLLANATSAILGMTPGEVFSHPGLYHLESRQLKEALAVMQAQRIAVVNLPDTPVRLLVAATRWLPLAISRPVLRKAVGGGRGAKMPSFYIDLQNQRGITEVDYLNGAVVRFGAQGNIATPVNHILTETLTKIAEGTISRDTYLRNPDKFIALFSVNHRIVP